MGLISFYYFIFLIKTEVFQLQVIVLPHFVIFTETSTAKPPAPRLVCEAS